MATEEVGEHCDPDSVTELGTHIHRQMHIHITQREHMDVIFSQFDATLTQPVT